MGKKITIGKQVVVKPNRKIKYAGPRSLPIEFKRGVLSTSHKPTIRFLDSHIKGNRAVDVWAKEQAAANIYINSLKHTEMWRRISRAIVKLEREAFFAGVEYQKSQNKRK